MTQHNEEITAFRIIYSAHDPHVAQQVTSELTDLFITENLKVRQEQSEGTTKFIERPAAGSPGEPLAAGGKGSRVPRGARRRVAVPAG